MKGRFWHDFLEICTAVCTKIKEQFAQKSRSSLLAHFPRKSIQHIVVFLHANQGPYNVFIAGCTAAVKAESGHENRGGRTAAVKAKSGHKNREGCTAFIAVLFCCLLVFSSCL